MKERLYNIIKENCIKVGGYELVSGEDSDIYFDIKSIGLNPKWLYIYYKSIEEILNGFDVNCYAGVVLGGCAFATISSSLQYLYYGKIIETLYIRKEVKNYGEGKRIEGKFKKNDRAILFEDVVTSGGSVIRAIELLRENGIDVICVISVVNRNNEGRKNINKVGVKYISLFELSDFNI